jgi:hypothetical protein
VPYFAGPVADERDALLTFLGVQRAALRAAEDGDDFKISTELAAFYFDHFEIPSASEAPLTVISPGALG